MFLNKLLLKDFGEFHNKEIELKPGINLVYCDKNMGKTTVRDFVTAMFYGMHTSKGLEQGKAYLRDGEDTYLLERSFSRHNNKLIALNIRTGRELKVDRKLGLVTVLFDTDKTTYESTHCICMPTDDSASDIAHELDGYLTRLATTGSPDIDKEVAVERLKKKRKKFDIRPYESKMSKLEVELDTYSTVDEELSDIRNQIKEVDQEFAIETARRKREARKLIETDEGTDYEDDDELVEGLDALAKTSTFLDTDMHEGEKPPKPLNERWWYIALNAILVIAVITLLVNIMPFEHAVRQLFEVCTVLLVAVTIVEGLYANGVLEGNEEYTPSEADFKQVIYELERKTEAYQDVEIDMSFASEYMEEKAKLKEKENALLARIEERNALEEEYHRCKAKLAELEKEIHAINLAINTIMDISNEIQSKMDGIINGHISDIVTKLTNGRYTDVSWDAKKHIQVYSGNIIESLYDVEKTYVKRINLAVRLCVAKLMSKDNLPVVIDGVLDDIDKDTLEVIINYLEGFDTEQVIILTEDGENADSFVKVSEKTNYVKIV